MDALSPARRVLFTVVNTSTAPVWLAMIIAPRSRVTAALVQRLGPLFIALGLTYDVLLGGAAAGGARLDFRDPDSLRRAFGKPDVFLAGWTHYIAFDLFVGRWIWQDALERGRGARLALLLTWLAGPAGLSLHLLRRR